MQKMEDEPTFVAEPVTLCIINFNGVEHLRRAFESIDRQPWRFAEVLLVDNASEDDSVAVARALCPGVRVVQLPANRGPGAARNAGFSAARHDLILFIDNDVRLERETVSALIRRVRVSDGVLAAAPRVVYADRPDTIQFDSADCHFLGLMATRHADQQLGAVEEEAAATTSLVSACFMIDRSRWREGDLFDETLGFNLEDHDFAVRARLAGHELWVEPAARVQHGSGTPGLSYRPGVTVSPQRLYYLTLNRWIVMTKCYSAKTLVLLSPALIAFELMQLAWLTSQGAGRVWLQALRTYRARRAELMVVRAATQRARRIPDGVVLREAGLPMTRGARESFVGRHFASAADRALRAWWRLVERPLRWDWR